MKFVHLADIHIKNYKYHKEYEKVIFDFLDMIYEEEPDNIIICGDVFHTKNRISPEAYDMFSWFLSEILNRTVARIHIITGNHDMVLSNKERMDSITPVINAMDEPRIHYHTKSGFYDLGENFRLNILSLSDKEKWNFNIDREKINICLYHGSVVGVETDTGWIVDKGDIDIEQLKKFDYVFLGDIHKYSELDKEGKIRYCGSFIQGNFGETDDKGFLIWEIEDKNKFTVKRKIIENPYPFTTIELLTNNKLPKKINIKKGSKIRIVSKSNLAYDKIQNIKSELQLKYEPESIVFFNNVVRKVTNKNDPENIFFKENLRDISVQEKLIKEYLRDFNLSEETLQKIFELNVRVNDLVDREEEVSRNINWRIKTCKWDNLFNYGEENKIDFEKLNGIVGIFGKSWSGKSSAVETILYTIFNSISKNVRKNLNIINQNKDYGKGEIELEIQGDNYNYYIDRISEKYIKKLKGETTNEAKTAVNFYRINKETGEEENLNGFERNDTDKEIRKIFGTLEDFLLTSMSSQFGFLSFLNEGSTRRKEILSKFLDLTQFDKKFDIVKERYLELRSSIKKQEDNNYDKLLKQNEKEINNNNNFIEKKTEEIKKIENKKEELEEVVSNIKLEIGKIKLCEINIEQLDIEEKNLKKEKKYILNEIEKLKIGLEKCDAYVEKASNFLKDVFDIEEYKNKKNKILLYENKKNEIISLLKQSKILLETNSNKTKLLKEVPCGKEYSNCKFIKDAYIAIGEIEKIKNEIDLSNKKLNELNTEIENLNPKEVDSFIENYEKVVEKLTKTKVECSELKIKLMNAENKYDTIEEKIQDTQKTRIEYERNKEEINRREKLRETLNKEEVNLTKIKEIISEETNELLSFKVLSGMLQQERENISKKKEELQKNYDEYNVSDLFLKCFHSNGISSLIINNNLPFINEEISKILVNVVKFKVFLANEEGKLEIYIQHSNYESRPIELASGAEKSLASLAIRLALTKITNLPKSPIFILDEPAVNLDDNLLENFIGMLNVLKNDFEVVILISHLEVLKDVVDMTIDIEKDENGYAKIYI